MIRGSTAFGWRQEAKPRIKSGAMGQAVTHIARLLFIAFAFFLVGAQAIACANLTPAGERREAAHRARYLASADKIVVG
ncbi:MAG: hypothetical protein B7Z20_12510, partial [Sphingobium sp. 32-64-5]